MKKIFCLAVAIIVPQIDAMDKERPVKAPLLATTKTQLPHNFFEYPCQLVFTPDDTQLACATDIGKQVYLFDLIDTKERPKSFECEGTQIKIGISPDGLFLAALDSKGKMYVWDSATNQLIKTIDGLSDGLKSIQYSPDGATILVAAGKKLKRFSAQCQDVVEEYQLDDCSTCMALSTDGNQIALSTFAGIQLFDERKSSAPVMSASRPPCKALTFNPDGSELVGSRASELVIWNCKTGGVKDTLVSDWTFSSSTHHLAFTSDGQWLFHAAGKDITLCSGDSYQPLYRLPQNDEVRGFALSNNEKLAASGDIDAEGWNTLEIKSLAAFDQVRKK